MYLRPLIHTELIRQRQQELTLRTSRARLSVEQASRSRLGKQAGKIGVLIIAAITILALTATSSYAATGKKRPNHGTPPKGATWSVFQDGTGKIIIRIGPKIIYIYYPAPAQPSVSSSTAENNDCADYQLNCTNEQNCKYWGVNCGLVETTTNESQTASEDTSANDAAPSETDSVSADAATDAAASTDTAATDQSANLADPSQNTEEDC